MVFDVSDGQGIQALDIGSVLSWLRGDTIVSGCAPSAGSGSLEVDIASGTARVNGTNVAVGSGTATLSDGGSNPRKDVVYIDSGGAIQVAEGTAATAQPSGNSRFNTYDPSPPDLSSTDAAVVAEVWVAAGKTGTFAAADIRDRRVLSSADLDSISVGEINNDGSPVDLGDILSRLDISEDGTSTVYRATGGLDGGGGQTQLQPTNNVQTSAEAIYTMPSGDIVGGFLLVIGDEQGAANRFSEWLHITFATSPTVESTVAPGSPAGRTYSRNGRDIRLAMASGTYDIATHAFIARREPNATS